MTARAEAALQRQLSNHEITSDDYDERGSSLIETTPLAVLKVSMERREMGKAALDAAYGSSEA